MKWPWHLLAQVKGLSYKRLRRTRIETLESDSMQAAALPEGATERGGRTDGRKQRKTRVTERRGLCGLSDREPHWAEELRCKDVCSLEVDQKGSSDWGDVTWERQVIHQLLSLHCMNICPVNLSAFLHSSTHRRPPVFTFSLFSLSVAEKKPNIIHSNFFHLCVLCSPLIYCWTCLQNDPEAFHSVKEEKKNSSSEGKKHIQKQKRKPVQWELACNP